MDPNAILNSPNKSTGQDTEAIFRIVGRLYTSIGTNPDISAAVYEAIEGYPQQEDAQTRFVPIIAAPRAYDDPSASENNFRWLSAL